MSGQREPADIGEVKARIQMLAEEIAVLRAVAGDDPRRATADRVVAVNADMIGRLRLLLPGIPTGHVNPVGDVIPGPATGPVLVLPVDDLVKVS
jgi:hypothetical protein